MTIVIVHTLHYPCCTRTMGMSMPCALVFPVAPQRSGIGGRAWHGCKRSAEVISIGYVTTGAMVGSGVLGFLAGLFSFKVKTQWCRDCSEQLRCVACLRREAASPEQTAV